MQFPVGLGMLERHRIWLDVNPIAGSTAPAIGAQSTSWRFDPMGEKQNQPCQLSFRHERRWAVALVSLVVGWGIPAMAQPHPVKGAGSSSVILDSKLTILQSPDEPFPIRRAVEDLANDFAKALGAEPRTVTRDEDAGPMTIMIGEQSKIPEAMRAANLTEPESFSISVSRPAWNQKSSRVVVLSGADVRGTIYAIYQFSQEYLGVDPLYYWTDHEPLRRTEIEIPASLKETFPAPVFKYRGFFLNDEDLLTGWAPGEKKDKTGISLEVWNKVYETILRLKGNMVVPGTWIFPNDPQVKLASERGLIVTQHHAIPLGLNVARWPKDVPYNYTTHPEILERAWKDAVSSYSPGEDILWAVGLRGLSDVSYASMDPSVRDNDKALGHLIGKAIADQMSIVRAVHPDAKFVTDLWQEGARLVQEGYLVIPPEVTTVWADTGYGYLQDNGDVTSGQGAYYHVAMMNGRANQLTEMVPVERILSELGRYIKAGATQYLLLNTSDIRPVTMTSRVVMDVAWKGLPPGDGNQSAQVYRGWASEEFGEKAASQVATVYKEYFDAPAHFGQPAEEYGDNLYHTEARQMLLTYMIESPLYALPSQSPKWEPARILGEAPGRPSGKEWLNQTITKEIQQCGDAQPRWDAVWKDALAAEPLVAPERRPFYRSEMLTMIAINRQSNRMLFEVSRSIQDAENGEMAEASRSAAQALSALDDIHRAQADAEYGKWKNWYRGDWLTGVYRTHEILQAYSDYLNDPLTHLPPPAVWSGWEAYYHIMHYEGDRSADVK
jgi:Glycosyl hydrolase family 115